jgi:hypothetical protein
MKLSNRSSFYLYHILLHSYLFISSGNPVMKTSLAKQVLKYPALKYLQISTEGINLILYLRVDFLKYIILSIFVHPGC